MTKARIATVDAFAKINLGLRVLFRRPDAFHELRTVFQTISLSDRINIAVQPSRQTSVTVDGMPDVQDNLAAHAAYSVLEEVHAAAQIQIQITKRIPMGAGLGGGSSDAAAVLLALPVLLGIAIPMRRLLALAAPLGSDVPFFLFGGAAVGMGRGEELYPLPDYPALSGLLIAPGIHVSTPEAYRALSPTLTSPEQKLGEFQESVREPLVQPLVNDFEPVVFALHPRLRAIKRGLLKQGAVHALMSGSGSSIFGLYERKEAVPGSVEKSFRISFLSGSRYRSRWLKSLAPHVDGDQWPPRSRYAR